jgi:rSAM-associated Gly-rich repeat protein
MKKSSSLLAAALQLLACASFITNSSSAKVDTTDSSKGTISERVTRIRTAMVEQTKPVTDDSSIHLTGWGNWHNGWRNWGNGWRKWGNGWRKWGNY